MIGFCGNPMTDIRVMEARPNVGPGGTFGMSVRAAASAALLEVAVTEQSAGAVVSMSARWKVELAAPDAIWLEVTYESPGERHGDLPL